MRDDPGLTVRGAAVRLTMVAYDDLGEDSVAEARAEESAERKLRRWIDLLVKSRGDSQ